VQQVVVSPAQQGVKLIAFLQQQVPGVSARALKRALESNACRVNGRVERFASVSLSSGDRIEFAQKWQPETRAQASKTLYEDEWLLAIDKPAGWVCEESSRNHWVGNYSLVHRLDRETTGVLLLAKTPAMRDQLMDLFANRKIEKFYLALVDGTPAREEGCCESKLGKKSFFQGQTVWGTTPDGLPAKTYWKRLRTFPTAALLECQPVTGRTHQIRAHLAEMGHPLLIDRQYAEGFRTSLFIRRPLLHASRVSFFHPQLRRAILIEAPLPEDFTTVLEQL
jgi:RluA family pseudouridine synthase